MNKNLGKFLQFEMGIDILYLHIFCDYFKFIYTRCLILNWKCVFYFTWCGETVNSGGKFKCWRIRERWQKSGDWNEMSQVASTPACAWSSQELGESVPRKGLHFSIPSSAIPNIQGVYSVFICKSAIYCWRPVWPGEVAELGAGLLTIYQTCPLVFILQY